MKFAVASALLDACVLGVIYRAPTYGYDLTQNIKTTIDVSESTLYPVLRRLLKEGLLDSYDEPFDGRNRRYYRITGKGELALHNYILNWHSFKKDIEKLLTGGSSGE